MLSLSGHLETVEVFSVDNSHVFFSPFSYFTKKYPSTPSISTQRAGRMTCSVTPATSSLERSSTRSLKTGSLLCFLMVSLETFTQFCCHFSFFFQLPLKGSVYKIWLDLIFVNWRKLNSNRKYKNQNA